jgi:hypothetical protein
MLLLERGFYRAQGILSFELRGRFVGSVKAVGSDAVKLQADTGRTRPGICGGGVAFDFPSSASIASPHNCGISVLMITSGPYERRLLTLQPLVAVVLVDEDII